MISDSNVYPSYPSLNVKNMLKVNNVELWLAWYKEGTQNNNKQSRKSLLKWQKNGALAEKRVHKT